MDRSRFSQREIKETKESPTTDSLIHFVSDGWTRAESKVRQGEEKRKERARETDHWPSTTASEGRQVVRDGGERERERESKRVKRKKKSTSEADAIDSSILQITRCYKFNGLSYSLPLFSYSFFFSVFFSSPSSTFLLEHSLFSVILYNKSNCSWDESPEKLQGEVKRDTIVSLWVEKFTAATAEPVAHMMSYFHLSAERKKRRERERE